MPFCYFLYLLSIFFIPTILLHPHKQRKQRAPIKRNERIKIGVSAIDCFIAHKQQKYNCRSNAKAHKVEDFYKDNKDNLKKLTETDDSEKEVVAKQSGKMIYIGTKAAIKAA